MIKYRKHQSKIIKYLKDLISEMKTKIASNHMNYFDIIGEMKRYKTENEQFLLKLTHFRKVIIKLKYY